VPVQFAATPSHGHGAELAANGRFRLACPRLQHGERVAKDIASRHEVVPTTTGFHLLVESTGIKMPSEGEWKTKSTALIIVVSGARSILALMQPHPKSGPLNCLVPQG
jgi:hypothetical protein